jgi:hypothetical protein
MMSSGKDSAALALALAELGRTDIPCVTYSAGPDDPEPRVAAEMCRRLGLDHSAVEMPASPERVRATLTRFFAESARPGVDLAQVPYAIAVAGSGAADGGVVLDGGGNDVFMGLPVTGKYRTKMRLRLRGRRLIDLAQRLTPVDSPVNYVARTRAEAALAGRNLRFRETSQFLPGAVDTRQYWRDLDRETAHLSPLDLMAYTERHMGPGASQKKHLLAAKAMGYAAAVPWCDAEVADYYFHLPEEHRYDVKRGINKVLLRRMLLEFLDYDATKIGKHYFGFDGAEFVVDNIDFIRSEIRSCVLWERSGLGIVEQWLDEIERRPFLYHSILDVFMVSGWHNHSRFVQSAVRDDDDE